MLGQRLATPFSQPPALETAPTRARSAEAMAFVDHWGYNVYDLFGPLRRRNVLPGHSTW